MSKPTPPSNLPPPIPAEEDSLLMDLNPLEEIVAGQEGISSENSITLELPAFDVATGDAPPPTTLPHEPPAPAVENLITPTAPSGEAEENSLPFAIEATSGIVPGGIFEAPQASEAMETIDVSSALPPGMTAPSPSPSLSESTLAQFNSPLSPQESFESPSESLGLGSGELASTELPPIDSADLGVSSLGGFTPDRTSPTIQLPSFDTSNEASPVTSSPPSMTDLPPVDAPLDAEKDPEKPELHSFEMTAPETNEPLKTFAPPPPPEVNTQDVSVQTEVIKNYIPGASLDDVKEFAEQVSPSKESIPAAYPFSLLIEGTLTEAEQERFSDLIESQALGIRAVDLEPQFENGKILIPRVSEYAGILLAHSLRSANVKMSFGLSDEIFSTEDTQTRPDESIARTTEIKSVTKNLKKSHKSTILVTQLPYLEGYPPVNVIDVITANINIRSSLLEPENSLEYQDAVDRLILELKQKAKIKGAQAVLNFTVQLTPTQSPLTYKLMAIGSAVKTVLDQ